MAEIKEQSVVAEKPKAAKVAEKAKLNEAVNKLAKFGGFGFLESSVEGIASMNPERAARKKAFLNDNATKSARETLKSNINLWLELLASSGSVSEMLDKSKESAEKASELLKDNQLKAVEGVYDLEKSYRNVMLFYKNTEEEKLKNISIVNAAPEQITDLDNSRFIDHVANELKQNYDKLDLRENYSLLVIPGYLGSAKVLDKWSKIAYDNVG